MGSLLLLGAGGKGGGGAGDVTAPTITSANTASNPEGSVLAHALTADEAVTWSIVGGADSARFEISGSTLRWASNGVKDFASPDDADTNNTYIVQVRATDAVSLTTDQTITVTVTDVVTWDAATVTAVTLSGGNLVATNTGTTSLNQGAKVATASGKTSGKYYFEVTFTTLAAGNTSHGTGIGTTASTYTNMGNTATTGVVMYRSGNVWANGGSAGVGLSARSQGDVIGMAVDLTNRKMWFRVAPSGNWNNSGTANPATNTGGVTIPAGTMVPFATFGGTSGTASNVQTANFGASAFTGTVPSGFSSGWI